MKIHHRTGHYDAFASKLLNGKLQLAFPKGSDEAMPVEGNPEDWVARRGDNSTWVNVAVALKVGAIYYISDGSLAWGPADLDSDAEAGAQAPPQPLQKAGVFVVHSLDRSEASIYIGKADAVKYCLHTQEVALIGQIDGVVQDAQEVADNLGLEFLGYYLTELKKKA